MNNPDTLTRVERACADLTKAGQPVTFTAVANATGLSRATLYRNPDLRATITEHRAHIAQAGTLGGHWNAPETTNQPNSTHPNIPFAFIDWPINVTTTP